MKIYYRISDNSYNKDRLEWATKEYCLKNFTDKFYYHKHNITVIADNVSAETLQMIERYTPSNQIIQTQYGHGALTFNHALQLAMKLDIDDKVYFVEDDYLHRDDADLVLSDLLDTAPIATLYDHPDKYLNPSEGGNPHCSGRSEQTRLYLGKYSHYKLTNSTTMTFGVTVKTLKLIYDIINQWTSKEHPSYYPYDYYMFQQLISMGYLIVSSVPGYATHTETRWLSPLVEWGEV
jgi:hypothetical protein